jgi:hypothetical protein
LDVPQEDRKGLEDRLLKETSTMPVFVENELADLHYNGFSNRYYIVCWFYNIVLLSDF